MFGFSTFVAVQNEVRACCGLPKLDLGTTARPGILTLRKEGMARMLRTPTRADSIIAWPVVSKVSAAIVGVVICKQICVIEARTEGKGANLTKQWSYSV